MRRGQIKCLIDADLLLWEAGFAGQLKDEETGELTMLDFDNVKEVFDQKIKEIEEACWSDEPSVLYFTGDANLVRLLNRERKRNDEEPLEFRPNFRVEVANTTPYKQRKSVRPLHYYNLRAYAMASYPTVVALGMEADDRLAIDQDVEGLTTIICSRDKDLRQVEGMSYSWECGAQPAWGPKKVDRIGELSLPKPNKLVGEGLKFFYSQIITGDAVDSIPGLPRGGPALAYKALNACETEEEMYEEVAKLYHKKFGEGWLVHLTEQANLLWMVREIKDGKPVMYQLPLEEHELRFLQTEGE